MGVSDRLAALDRRVLGQRPGSRVQPARKVLRRYCTYGGGTILLLGVPIAALTGDYFVIVLPAMQVLVWTALLVARVGLKGIKANVPVRPLPTRSSAPIPKS